MDSKKAQTCLDDREKEDVARAEDSGQGSGERNRTVNLGLGVQVQILTP